MSSVRQGLDARIALGTRLFIESIKKMTAVYFTTMPCEANTGNWREEGLIFLGIDPLRGQSLKFL